MARSRKPNEIALPPSPHKDLSSVPGTPTPTSLNPSTNEPSPLPPNYIYSNSPVSPVTPDILGPWPRNTMDMLGLATPERAEFGGFEKDDRLKKSGGNVITRRLVMYSVLVVFVAVVLAGVQYSMGNGPGKPWRECDSGRAVS